MTPEEGMHLEKAEAVKDLVAFRKMYGVLLDRIRECEEEGIPTEMKALLRWPGTAAIKGMLEVLVYQMEHTVRTYDELTKNEVEHVHHTEAEPANNVVVFPVREKQP